MRRIRSWCVIAASSASALGFGSAASGPAPVPPATAPDTSAALSPADSGYADAVAFGRWLEDRGFRVRLVARSQVSGFMGEPRAASYLTDRGNFAVVFFPAHDGAERVRITCELKRGQYLYTYRTHQPGLRRVLTERHDSPQRFVVKGRWFIFVWDGATEQALKDVLTGS